MPTVIAGVTLISRKWGNTIGGMIASMPWVAGPIVLFIALEQGKEFAVLSIPGVMMGIIGWLAFCYAYIYAGLRFNVIISVLLGYLAYLVTGGLLQWLDRDLGMYFWVVAALIFISIAFYFFPSASYSPVTKSKKLRFDIPLRMLVMTSFVILVTYFAGALGPVWSGILTPIPVMTAVLAMFTHYTQGITATIVILRGMFIGIYGFTAFLFAMGLLLPHYSIWVTFVLSLIINVLVSILVKFFIRS